MLTLTKPVLVWHNGNWSKVDDVFPRDNFFQTKLQQHIESVKGKTSQEMALLALEVELEKGKVIHLGDGAAKRSFRYKFIKEKGNESKANPTVH
jgi:hypothetical protein